MAELTNDTALTGLVPGRDYPRTYREFVERYPDDAGCAAWLEQLRWPRGFVCPKCGTMAASWWQTRGRLVCSSCRHQATVTAGTILDKTRTPLTTWFEAAWHYLEEFTFGDARKLFDRLRGSNPVTEVKPGVFTAPGTKGGTVTFRATSKSGPPTVDVHGIEEGIRKIKFVDQ